MGGLRTFDPKGALDRGTTLIEASAGTGKTFTITSLFLRLLLDHDIRVDQILVVTFTEAATAELRDRIRSRLRQALRLFQGEPVEHDPLISELFHRAKEAETLSQDTIKLERALSNFDEAVISTIHGFCQRVLHENAFESGVSFDLELITDEKLLRDQVVRDFWIRELHNAEPDLYQFLVSPKGVGKKQFKISLDRLSELGQKVCSQREMKILPKISSEPPPSPDPNRWTEKLDRAISLFNAERTAIETALGEAELYKTLQDKIPTFIAEIEGWIKDEPQPVTPIPPSIIGLAASSIAKKTKKGKKPPEHPFFSACEELWALENERNEHLEARALDMILRCVSFVREELAARKKSKRLQSFDDLLHHLADALRGPNGERLASILSTQFQAVLIDEFQDTDPIQYEIFSRVFGHDRGFLLLIGDPKQAIYSFRGADIYAYLQAVQAAQDRCFTLGVNWRSDERFVCALDHLFGRHGLPFADQKIGFIKVEASQTDDRFAFPDQSGSPLVIRFAKVDDFPQYQDTRRKKTPRLRKAWGRKELPLLLACEISELLQSGAIVDGRPISPSDIAVLVRKNDQAREVQHALRQLQIPSVFHGASSVFLSNESEELRLILAAIAEPTHSTRVKAALATETLGLTVFDLQKLEADERAWETQVERFRQLHQLWVDHGFMRMFRHLVEESELSARLLSLADGERRLTNLIHLGELLHRAATDQRLGLAGLLRWYDWQRTLGSEDSDAVQMRLESDEQAVRIVTIFKAKGLQYPVVFCPYTWDGAGLHQNEASQPRFHDREHNFELGIDLGSPDFETHKAIADYENRAESLRLLYVALTRAQHRCVVYAGALADIEKSSFGFLTFAPKTSGDGQAGFASAQDTIKKLTSDQMFAELENLAETSDGTIEVTSLEKRAHIPVYQGPVEAPEELEVRALGRQFNRHFRTASFTQLTSGTSWMGFAAESLDRDEGLEEESERKVESDGTDDQREKSPLHHFERGAEAGTFLHSVLELADFQYQDLAELRAIVGDRLDYYGLPVDQWLDTVTEGLDLAIKTPLSTHDQESFRLCDIARSERLDELEFTFPVGQNGSGKGFRAEPFSEVFQKHRNHRMPLDYPRQISALGFEPLTGFLKGFIDLVFRHNNKWYVVDYKSNHLGDYFENYKEERLIETMAHHHYYIQYHLYVLAVHRYLSWQLPGYDYERDFGGVFYLFLRGMNPETDRGFGVFRDHPSRPFINELSELMEGVK